MSVQSQKCLHYVNYSCSRETHYLSMPLMLRLMLQYNYTAEHIAQLATALNSKLNVSVCAICDFSQGRPATEFLLSAHPAGHT